MNRTLIPVFVTAGIMLVPCSDACARHGPAAGLPAIHQRGTSCTHPTATAATDKPIPEGSPAAPRVGPLTFHPYPYQFGTPTKVLIHQVSTAAGPVSLTGYNCHDRRPLRFWYTDAGLPQSLKRAPNEGQHVAVLPSCQMPCTDYTGYMIFTEPGQWNVIASLGTAVLGNIVITVSRA